MVSEILPPKRHLRDVPWVLLPGGLLCISKSIFPAFFQHVQLTSRSQVLFNHTFSTVSVDMQTEISAECIRKPLLPPTSGHVHSVVARNRGEFLQKQSTNCYGHKRQKKWFWEEGLPAPSAKALLRYNAYRTLCQLAMLQCDRIWYRFTRRNNYHKKVS